MFYHINNNTKHNALLQVILRNKSIKYNLNNEKKNRNCRAMTYYEL